MICLTHIPKTGGTTFRHILINNYSWRHIDIPVKPRNTVVNQNAFPFNSFIISQLKSLSGHRLQYSPKIQSNFPNAKFVVFLREPISRIISLFFHIQRYENPNVVFHEWVTDNITSPILNDFQTRFIAGHVDLDIAKSILHHGYFFAGTTNRFDQSILLLRRMLKNGFTIKYKRKRSSSKNPLDILEHPKNSKLLSTLRQNNRNDSLLCDFIETRLFEKYEKLYGHISKNDIDNLLVSNDNFSENGRQVLLFRAVKYLLFENMFRLRRH